MTKLNLTVSESLAQATAASHIFILDNDSTKNYSDVYDMALEDPEGALAAGEFGLHDDYVHHEAEGLIESLTGLAGNVKDTLKRYGELIKAGAVIHAIRGNMDGDVTAWDLDEFARLGGAVEEGITFQGIRYTYNHTDGHWESTEGQILSSHWSNNFFPEGFYESQGSNESQALFHQLAIGAAIVVTEPKHEYSTHVHSFAGTVVSFNALEIEVRDQEDNHFTIEFDEVETIESDPA